MCVGGELYRAIGSFGVKDRRNCCKVDWDARGHEFESRSLSTTLCFPERFLRVVALVKIQKKNLIKRLVLFFFFIRNFISFHLF